MGIRTTGGQIAKIPDESAPGLIRIARAGRPRGMRGGGKRKPQRLFQLDDPLARAGLHRHHRHAEFRGKFRRIQAQPGFLRHVHHVEGEDRGDLQFDDLQRELEMALEMRGV